MHTVNLIKEGINRARHHWFKQKNQYSYQVELPGADMLVGLGMVFVLDLIE